MSYQRNGDISLQSKLLNYSLKVQKISGLHPHQKKRYMLYGLFNSLTHLVSMGLVVYMITCNLNDIETLMVGFDSFISHIQALLKFLPVLLHRKEMLFLLDGLPKFWRTKNAEDYKFWIKLSKIYITLIFLAQVGLISFPGFLFKSYVPDFPHSYTILLIHQKIQFMYASLIVLGTDLFYLALFGIIKVQFQTLKVDLEVLKMSVNKNDLLKLWINQHIFLTKYTKCFARTFSEASLMQYVVASVNLCTEVFFFSERGTDGLFMTVIYIIELLAQICLICLTADEITSRALELADALYSMQWYDFHCKERKMLPLLIQQAQEPLRFVAGGLVNLDKPAITTILRNSYTFYTLARQMNHN